MKLWGPGSFKSTLLPPVKLQEVSLRCLDLPDLASLLGALLGHTSLWDFGAYSHLTDSP